MNTFLPLKRLIIWWGRQRDEKATYNANNRAWGHPQMEAQTPARPPATWETGGSLSVFRDLQERTGQRHPGTLSRACEETCVTVTGPTGSLPKRRGAERRGLEQASEDIPRAALCGRNL